jgi:hypothetical protein
LQSVKWCWWRGSETAPWVMQSRPATDTDRWY